MRDMKVSMPFISWKIRCLHRKDKRFFDREVVPDLSKTTDSEVGEILELLEPRTDPRIVQFRFRFREVSKEESRRLAKHCRAMKAFVVPGYFEDEDGNPMDENGVCRVLTGQTHPVLRGRPHSVLQLGPCAIIRQEQWSVVGANDISHFLAVVRAIAESRWLKAPLSMEFTGTFGDIQQILSFDEPDREAVKAVVLPIRQLYSSDDILNIACKVYLRHVADERKRWWVQERKDAFNRHRDSPPHLSRLGEYSTQKIIETVIYGLGIVHRRSKANSEEDLRILMNKHRRECVVMAFNCACRDFCRFAFDIYLVVKQDFEHWIRNEGCAGPNRITLDDVIH
jgi:hypothetical protein